MAYYLSAFGTVALPLVQPLAELPTLPGKPGAVATVSGGYDAWGSDSAPHIFPQPITYRVIATGADVTAYMAAVNSLRAMSRTRAYLYRTGQNGRLDRALARCLSVEQRDSVTTAAAIELALNFELWEVWQNDWEKRARYFNETPTWYFDTGIFLDSSALSTTLTGSPQTITVTNDGNSPIEDTIITITAGSAAITVVSVAASGSKWTWTGAGANPSIAAGKSLVVDCGALSVEDDTADAFAYFTLDATHVIVPWLRLAPGANSVVVTYTGGGTGSTIKFDFADRWA